MCNVIGQPSHISPFISEFVFVWGARHYEKKRAHIFVNIESSVIYVNDPVFSQKGNIPPPPESPHSLADSSYDEDDDFDDDDDDDFDVSGGGGEDDPSKDE